MIVKLKTQQHKVILELDIELLSGNSPPDYLLTYDKESIFNNNLPSQIFNKSKTKVTGKVIGFFLVLNNRTLAKIKVKAHINVNFESDGSSEQVASLEFENENGEKEITVEAQTLSRVMNGSIFFKS